MNTYIYEPILDNIPLGYTIRVEALTESEAEGLKQGIAQQYIKEGDAQTVSFRFVGISYDDSY